MISHFHHVNRLINQFQHNDFKRKFQPERTRQNQIKEILPGQKKCLKVLKNPASKIFPQCNLTQQHKTEYDIPLSLH